MPEPELVDLDEATTAVSADVVAASDLPAFFDRSFTTLPARLTACEPTRRAMNPDVLW